MKTLLAHVRPVLLALPVSAIASTAGADVTGIYRWNATSVTSYDSLGAWANNQASGSQAATIANFTSTYIFGDFTQTTPGYVYKTLLRADGAGINQIVRYAAPVGNALANLVSNTGGEVFNLSTVRNGMDDFFCDGVSFYKNISGAVGTPGGWKYSSFANLVADVGGTFYSYAQGPFNFSDRFFGFEGKIYRTGSNGNGQTANYSVYNSFNDLVSGNIAQTVTFSQPYAGWEGFMAVPAPGALALVGLAGLGGGRRRRA